MGVRDLFRSPITIAITDKNKNKKPKKNEGQQDPRIDNCITVKIIYMYACMDIVGVNKRRPIKIIQITN
jgi:hypothetical protein